MSVKSTFLCMSRFRSSHIACLVTLHCEDITWALWHLNTLRPRRNGHHFADDIFKRIFFNENVWISINFSLKFVPRCPINNIPALVQIMAWRRPDDKPLSEPMMVSLPTHICVTRPQWVKSPTTWLYIQELAQTSNKENVQVPHYWSFVNY